MRYDLDIHISKNAYAASSVSAGYFESGAAICLTTLINNQIAFLAIGEDESKYSQDPEFIKMKDSGKLTIWNPCSIEKFDPIQAAMIVRFYVKKVLSSKRSKWPRIIKWALWFFIDKCHLKIHIENYSKIESEQRVIFEKEVSEIRTVEKLEILET